MSLLNEVVRLSSDNDSLVIEEYKFGCIKQSYTSVLDDFVVR